MSDQKNQRGKVAEQRLMAIKAKRDMNKTIGETGVDRFKIIYGPSARLDESTAATKFCETVINGDYNDAWEWIAYIDNDPNIIDRYGRVPLIIAVRNKNLEIIKLLLDSGSNVFVQNKEHKSALTMALETRDAAIISIIQDAAKIQAKQFV